MKLDLMGAHFARLLVGAVILVGCAGRVTGSGRAPVPALDAPLYASEIGRTDSRTAYEAVNRLRPAFLHLVPMATRGALAPPPTAVYVNMRHAGGVEVLELIPATEIESIKVVKPMQTTIVFGTTLGGGAILVATRR